MNTVSSQYDAIIKYVFRPTLQKVDPIVKGHCIVQDRGLAIERDRASKTHDGTVYKAVPES